MSQRVGVLIIHGIGVPDPHFADGIIAELRQRFSARVAGRTPDPESQILFQPVLWAPVLQGREDQLWERLKASGPAEFAKLRRFMIDFAADALAYQPTPHDRGVYIGVHRLVAQAIRSVGVQAGPKTPLCIIAHSLGTVIASNYLYDLQAYPAKKLITAPVRRAMGRAPIDRGETLAALYTLGSPLALWSLRYDDFGVPIRVPPPGEWLNFYDPSDIIGFPLRGLNAAYRQAVTADRPVNVGNLLTSWNPASHIEYWTDNDITIPIAESLARIWGAANGLAI